MNSFSFAALTDVGTVRTNNEDSALASTTLLALADGMGGHAAGEVASAVVLHALGRLLAPEKEIGPDAVRDAALEARQALRAMSQADHDMEGMGTTLVAIGVGPEGTTLAHVGDSRLYRARHGELTQITTDHTHVQRLVDSGRLDPREVRTHPYRSVILRSIDDTSDDLPDVDLTGDLLPGDRLLLCSDGLSDYVTPEVIADALAHGSPLDAARELMAGALRAGTRDNVTVVVADVHDSEVTPVAPVATAAEAPVLVGASLGQAALTDEARAVLVAAFPDAATELDTLPRSPLPEGGGDPVVEPEPEPDTLEPEPVEPEPVEPEPEPAEDDGSAPPEPTPGGAEGEPPPALPTTAMDVVWLALVVATFAAVTLGVWMFEA